MESLSPRIVDFFVVGVQKGGTTALDLHMRQLPGIRMARQKEIHFFDDETLDWSIPAVDAFHESFDWSSRALRGEATPIYSYWPCAVDRIRRYNPAARLIMCLRHPAHRAYSHWRMETQRDSETLSFTEAISETGRQRVWTAPAGVHRVFSYVERGFYSEQIKRILSLFPRTQVHFLRTDHLWERPDDTLRTIMAFLGVAMKDYNLSRMHVPRGVKPSTGIPPATPEDMTSLTSLYREDIRLTEALTGIVLSDWLEGDYREPMAR